MALEERWNDSAREPKSQADINAAVAHRNLLIANSKTNPPVSKGLQSELARLLPLVK
jgi:hypothetical protein